MTSSSSWRTSRVRRPSARSIPSATNRWKPAACAPAWRGSMHLPLRRIFDDKRRVMIPVLAGLVLNVVLFVAVVYPLRARARTAETRAETAAQELQAAERDDADARGTTESRDRTKLALNAFYKDVLPASHAQARQATFLRLTQLAEQHNLEPSRRSTDPKQEKDSNLARLQISMTLQGNYDDIRRFIYH